MKSVLCFHVQKYNIYCFSYCTARTMQTGIWMFCKIPYKDLAAFTVLLLLPQYSSIICCIEITGLLTSWISWSFYNPNFFISPICCDSLWKVAGHGVQGVLTNKCRAELKESLQAIGGLNARAQSKSFCGTMLESSNFVFLLLKQIV